MKKIDGPDPRENRRKDQAQPHLRHLTPVSVKDICVAAAVHLHGLAGDFARQMLHKNTVLARDVIENLSPAFHDCERQMDRELFYLQK